MGMFAGYILECLQGIYGNVCRVYMGMFAELGNQHLTETLSSNAGLGVPRWGSFMIFFLSYLYGNVFRVYTGMSQETTRC